MHIADLTSGRQELGPTSTGTVAEEQSIGACRAAQVEAEAEGEAISTP